MSQIDFIIPNNSFHFNLVTPIIRNESVFYKLGIKINILNKLPTNFFGDILIITSRYFEVINLNDTKLIIDYLNSFREKYKRIIYFDTGDSTGSTLFEVLPFVDIYLKQFVLSDLSNYKKSYFQNRIWTDYYHLQHNVNDNEIYTSTHKIADHELSKIKCGWNYGMGNFYDNRILEKLARIFPHNKYLLDYSINIHNKSNDIFMRITSSYFLNSVSYQRQLLLNYGKNRNIETGRIPLRKYWSELGRSKISISPFGWGEICIRDFESIICQTCLFKPDITHLSTFPNYFIPDYTYVPFKWDLSNLDEKIESYLDNDFYKSIVSQMSDRYLYYSKSIKGNDEFVSYFTGLLT